MSIKHNTNELELKERLRKKAIRALWYENNREKVREQQKLRLDLIREGAYLSPYDRKKAKRLEAIEAAKTPTYLVTAEEEAKNYTLVDIAKLLGITPYKIQAIILTNKRYQFPKPMYTRVDGSAIYNKSIIDEWLPFGESLFAFKSKGRKIKIGGAALQIVKFMQANKKVIEYCDGLRRARGAVYG